MSSFVVRFARQAVIGALFVVAAVLGIASGVLFAYAGDLPEISALDDYSPSATTRVYDDSGGLIGQFALQRRLLVGYEAIAPRLREAIIAAEDGSFNSHSGLSMSRIAVTLIRDMLDGVRDRLAGRRSRPAGASTLTQQLARNLFPEAVGFTLGDTSLERKIKEALVALQIEKRYTKTEILTFYANHMLFGHGTYGVEAASRLYFDKSANDLALEEAALLAGILQSPARQSPFVSLDAARERRSYTLQRMADEGFITPEEADLTEERPIIVQDRPRVDDTIAPYFLEEVRRHLARQFGDGLLYEGGLSVRTSLDAELQKAATRAIDRGLREIDKREGYRRSAVKSVLTGESPEKSFRHERWDRPIAIGDIVPAVVTAVTPSVAQMRVGGYQGELRRDDFEWTNRTDATVLFNPGDLIEVALTEIDAESRTIRATLEQEPEVEGALIALDNRTGQIKAMVGGYDFRRSEFNRAVQAHRQIGSGFKPFLYAAAIDRGYTPVSTLPDTPLSFPSGPGQPPYEPNNYDGEFEGAVTLRRALEQSRNIPAVWMMNQLGPEQVVTFTRRFGLTGDLQPYLSLALGATEATLIEITSGYSVFPNQGVRMTPYSILQVSDRDGNVLEETRPRAQHAIRADTAFVMTNLLRGVVQRGTAARRVSAADLNWPLGGKTGTTDEYSDAWFVGFDPDITLGVWVGYDQPKSLGLSGTGAGSALPIWIEFMEAYLSGKDREQPPVFEPPSNIVFLGTQVTVEGDVDPGVGGTDEAFISGTQPR